MSASKDLERVARSMLAQKVEAEYVRHYLIEAYQIDNTLVDHIFERIGYAPKLAKGAKPPVKEGNVQRQKFY